LAASSGAKRIWKVKSFTPKEIVLEVIKFGWLLYPLLFLKSMLSCISSR
jgi:hypothetical protein